MSFKKILCIDFDGVIHSYQSGWKGANVVADEPVPGAIAWLIDMVYQDYDVQIYSARSKDSNGIEAMKQWLENQMHGVMVMPYEEILVNPRLFIDTYIKFPTEKPSAWLTIDDRAIVFRGTFPSITEIENFKPWNK